VARKTLLGCPNGSVHGAGLLLELDELLELLGELLLLELDDGRLLELDGMLFELDGVLLEPDETLLPLDSEELLRDELLLGGDKLLLEDGGALLCELALLNELVEDDEPFDLDDDELLEGGGYPLPELRLEVDELLLHGGGGTIGGVGPQGGAQLGGYGG